MGRVARLVLLLSAFLFLVSSAFNFCTLNFDSRFSTIKVRSGVTLSIDTAISNYTGTLKKYAGGTITGETITFNDGLFEDEGNELLLSAIFDPSGSILLSGGHTFRAAPGRVLQSVVISGTDNRIEGAPVFNSTFALQDLSSSVTLSVQSNVSKDIALNGGTVRLENNLSFIDNTILTGSGTVDGNGYVVETGSDEFTWTSTILFSNGSSIELNADKVDIGGVFTFDGIADINGNGGVVNFVSGGKLVITPGSTLHMTDLTLKGLGNEANQLIFQGSGSNIRISDVNIELTNDLTTTIGGIYVKSPGTVIVKEHTWTVDQLASMTVDGVTFWKDNAGSEVVGDVVFGSPESNYVTLIASGTLKSTSAVNIESRIEILESCCEEVRTSTGELQSQIDELGSVSDLQTSTGELQSQIDEWGSIIEEVITSTGELQSQLDECCAAVRTSTGELQSQIDVLESCCEEVLTSTGELQSQIDVIGSSTALIFSRIEILESCCEEVRTSTGELQSQLDECCAAVRTSTGELQSQIDVLESCCEEVLTSTGELQSQIDELGSSTALIFSSIEILESCCEEVRTSTGELQSQIDMLDTFTLLSRIELLESCCEAVRTSTGELQSQIDECCRCCDCIISITSPDTYFIPSVLPQMMPAADSAVVFRFEPCWGDEQVPRLIFDASNLPGGQVIFNRAARMIFQGEGIVELRDGVTFNFGNYVPIDPSRAYTDDRPQLIVEERAMMKPVENAEIDFTGWGKFKVRDAGMLWLDKPSQVVFGIDETDEFKVEVDAVGSIIVSDDADATIGNRLITFQLGTFELFFTRYSLLSVLYGTVEFNTNNDVSAPGSLATWVFSEGANLEVRRPDGLLRLSPNLDDSLVLFDNRTGFIDGGGLSGFGSGNMRFTTHDGLVDTTIRLQKNYFEQELTIVELFLNIGLVLKSGEPVVTPSDLDILVRLGDSTGTLAAIHPSRNGIVFALEDGDHDVGYFSIGAGGLGNFPIIGRDINGSMFEIDENGVRTTI